jgi:4-hydroxy-tetrahydrodipicolinate synthase
MVQGALSGVFAAAVTPLTADYNPDLEAIPPLLAFLARRGCHGALILGTTGEGPSFAPAERIAICRAAVRVREQHPGFRLLAGTGTPSLEETIELTRAAYDLGFDGTIVLPPYYFRRASDDGLFVWFAEVLRRGVPDGARLLGYHIPGVSGVPLSLDLIARLAAEFPGRFAGLKDSSADSDHARALGARFGRGLVVFNGTDPLFAPALAAGAAGCITAPANLYSPELRAVWDAHERGTDVPAVRARIAAIRAILDRYAPAPAILKALLAESAGFPRWPLRPPLLPLTPAVAAAATAELEGAGLLPAP